MRELPGLSSTRIVNSIFFPQYLFNVACFAGWRRCSRGCWRWWRTVRSCGMKGVSCGVCATCWRDRSAVRTIYTRTRRRCATSGRRSQPGWRYRRTTSKPFSRYQRYLLSKDFIYLETLRHYLDSKNSINLPSA